MKTGIIKKLLMILAVAGLAAVGIHFSRRAMSGAEKTV